jgi:hypothetical protein
LEKQRSSRTRKSRPLNACYPLLTEVAGGPTNGRVWPSIASATASAAATTATAAIPTAASAVTATCVGPNKAPDFRKMRVRQDRDAAQREGKQQLVLPRAGGCPAIAFSEPAHHAPSQLRPGRRGDDDGR